MQPVPKPPFLEALAEATFGRSRIASIENNVCLDCESEVDEDGFKDERSRREYTISGLCQECQDDVFGRGLMDESMRGREEGEDE